MSYQHHKMLLVPRRDVSLQRHQVKVEPLDEALACIVLRISHSLHLVLREKRVPRACTTGGKANGAIVKKQNRANTPFGCAA